MEEARRPPARGNGRFLLLASLALAFCFLQSGRAALGPPVASDRALSYQILQYVNGKMPSARKSLCWGPRAEVMDTVTECVTQVLGSDAVVLPFGSAANGCGLVSSDLDLTIYAPPECLAAYMQAAKERGPSIEQGKGSLESRLAQRVLNAVSQKSRIHRDIRVRQVVRQARVPIITFSTAAGPCDLSFGNYLPVYNTRLIRAYVELDARVPSLVYIVKHWAKSMRIAGTQHGYISSYSWTLLVIYFFQVQLGLPSLHAATQGEVPRFATDFEEGAAPQEAWRKRRGAENLGQLLRGFFDFYALDFDWDREVASVRLGQRTKIGDRRLHWTFRQVSPCGQLSIEDPVETERNLNFVMGKNGLQKVRQCISVAQENLAKGSGLPTEVLADLPALPKSWLENSEALVAQRAKAFLRVPQKRLVVRNWDTGEDLDFVELLSSQPSRYELAFRRAELAADMAKGL